MARTPIPFSILIKPTGAACNLDCSYCFFLSKEALWGTSEQRMSLETTDVLIRRYLESQPDGEVTIGWQGGEPTLRGLDFFREAVRLSKKYARSGQQVLHTLQTNGTLLDDEWGAFLAEEGFLVGLSIDGPERLHDTYRVNKAGRGTYAQVRKAWDLLQRHGVETNVLCTVSASNQHHPLEVYRHFRDDLGVKYVQFIPIVERVPEGMEAAAEAGWRDADGQFVLYTVGGDHVTSRTVDPDAFGRFLSTIFDEWVTRDIGTMFVQHFDVALGALLGRHTLCVHAPECGRAVAIEHTGEMYACDHYVEPDFRLGSVLDSDPRDLVRSPEQRQFGAAKRTELTAQCQRCEVRWACNGGCPKDRFAVSVDGEAGQNYLCSGYEQFFTHIWPELTLLAQLLRAGRPASDLLKMRKLTPGQRRSAKRRPSR